MISFEIPYPGIDPVAISVGPFDVRWYGLAYAAGLIIGWLYIRSLMSEQRLWGKAGPPFSMTKADDLVFWVFVGGVLGGRLGQVLLYDPAYFAANPLEIFQVWKGGMSFHGAVIGAMLSIIAFARRNGVGVRSVMDVACTGLPLGMILGRLANFINSEHWGRTSDVPWAMVFPDGGPLPRHPSQLYEAALEGLVLFLILRFVTHSLLGLRRPGMTAGVWLVWYALARFVCEFFREPELHHALNIGPFTAGQLYSIPMLLLGAYLLYTAAEEKPARRKLA